MMEIELDDRLAELHLKLEKARAVLSCLSNDLLDGNEPNGKYEYLYDLYQKLAFVVNEYLFEAEKDIRELREGE